MGTNSGAVQIWDPVAVKHINTLSGHSARVGKHLPLAHKCVIVWIVCRVDIVHCICPLHV